MENTLILDANPVSHDAGFQKTPTTHLKTKMFNAKATTSNIEADLYLPTLETFRGRAKGSFSSTDLKRMTSKKAFLDMKDWSNLGVSKPIKTALKVALNGL